MEGETVKRFIEVETITAGQARPYADSVEIARIKFTCSFRTDGRIEESDLNDDLVMRFCRGHFSWVDKPEWHESRLEYLKKIGNGVWEIKIVQPYLD